jgi:hypothetical protein
MAEQQHRATDSEWYCIKLRSSSVAVYSTILELRDRIKALETTQSGSVDLSHLSDAERGKIFKLLANPGRFEVLEVAQPAKPNYPAKPDSSLVEQVANAMDGGTEWRARAAIRAVAAWIEEHGGAQSALGWAMRLEREADR